MHGRCMLQIVRLYDFTSQKTSFRFRITTNSAEINRQVRRLTGRLTNMLVYNISVENVIEGFQRLKLGKSDGEEGLNFDLIFNSMLVHGYSPDSMLVGTIVPIPKDKRQLTCTADNVRTIILSNFVANLFDVIVLSWEQYALTTSQLQFGFKHMSTTHWTYIMMDTISHYNANCSNVYALMLDASKAFDRVNYCKLFRVLLKRQVSPLVLRLLLYMYTK